MRSVALCGFASKTRRVDWPKHFEIWTVNCAWDYGFTRIDRLFEMHPLDQLTADLDKTTKWEAKHWAWLQQPHNFPIYMLHADPRIPASVEYPLSDICQTIFPRIWREDGERIRYLTSSASYMLAMAIYERVDVVHVAGLEMASGSEYTYQRDGFTYLMGLANGRGINIMLPQNSDLMRAKLYSYEGGQMVYRDTILEHLADYQGQLDEMSMATVQDANIYRAQGAVIALTALLNNTELPFIGRQGLERLLQQYGEQHSRTMGYVNKFGPEKFGPAMMQAEGAIQAYEDLIDVCDLQTPDLTIRGITHWIQLNKIEQPAQEEV